jgi:hypothetical protein
MMDNPMMMAALMGGRDGHHHSGSIMEHPMMLAALMNR